MSILREVLIQAWDAVRRNRTRSLLTMLGIAWGIVAVALLMSYGGGFRGAIVPSVMTKSVLIDRQAVKPSVEMFVA